MPLIEELSRLQKEHAEGKLSEAALQESLRRLVDNEGAGDPAHLQDEFTKLRREAAINGLDREFEEIRKECLIYYKGRFSEPSVHKFWGHLWAVVFLIGLFVAVSVPFLRAEPSGGWLVAAFLAFVTGISVNSLVEVYRKGSRLDRAKATWQERRAQLANDGSPDTASAFGATSL